MMVKFNSFQRCMNHASVSRSNRNATMTTTTTVEPSVSVTTPSLYVSELKPPSDQYELQQYPTAPDVPGQPVKEACDGAYPII